MPWPQKPRLPGQSRYYSGRLKYGRANAVTDDLVRMIQSSKELTDCDINIHFTMHGQKRGSDEGFLFAPPEPHCIRPFEDLGVMFDEQDDDFYVWTESPLDESEFTHSSLELQTKHALCLPCRDTLNYFCQYTDARRKWDAEEGQADGVVFPMPRNVVHHSSLISLFAFKHDCFICSQLWNKLRAMYPASVLPPSEHSNYQIECCWERTPLETSELRMWFVMFNPSVEKDPYSNYQHLLPVGLWPKPHFSHHFVKQAAGPPLTPEATEGDQPDDGTNNDPRTRSLALAWLERCKMDTDGKHALCQRQNRQFLPTRLLDVRYALETGRVRLVQPSEEPRLFEESRFYASLSYCWGAWGASETPVLLAANLSDRKARGMDWDRLPRTYQDAIKVTAWFGWRWLWVDSLCIIQDSKSDWQREAAMMDRIYQNAQITISADVGDDCRTGCFTKRDQIDAKPIEFASTGSGSAWFMTTEAVFDWMTTAPSLSRAWIHRERQLSRRILHFTDKELVWECCGVGKEGFASETMPGGAPFELVFKGETKFQVKWSEANDTTGTDAETRLTDIQNLWNETCEGLSLKAVTYPTDMPVILSSLAKEFHQMIPNDEYVCGLWKSTFPQSLAWQVPYITNYEPSSAGYIAPTWSWLSAANPVVLVPQRSNIALPLAKVLEIRCEPDSDDPYGRLTSGELHMTGYLRRLHFRFASHAPTHFLLSVIDQGDDGEDRKRLISADWYEYEGQTCQYTTDFCINTIGDEEFDCYAFFTGMGETAPERDLLTCERVLSCILMRAVEGAEGTYRKVGTLAHMKDQLAFKLRYDVASIPEHEGLGYMEYRQMESDADWRTIFERPIERQPEDEVEIPPPTIWDLLAEYVRRTRWIVVDAAQRKEDKQREEKRKEEEKREDSEDEGTGESASDRVSAEGGLCRESDRYEDDLSHKEEDHAGMCLNPGEDTTPHGDTTLEEESAEGNSNNSDTSSGSVHQSGPEESVSTSEKADLVSPGEGAHGTKWNITNHLRELPFLELVEQLRKHLLCNAAVQDDEGEERRVMEQALTIESKTVAYGEKLDPEEALYQFDDALQRWQEEQGVFPWLQRLKPVKITLV